MGPVVKLLYLAGKFRDLGEELLDALLEGVGAFRDSLELLLERMFSNHRVRLRG